MNAADQKRTWRISTRLKEARAAAKEKLSQSELARRVEAHGVAKFPVGVASRIELGYTYATWQEVEALAAVLKVDANWLGGVGDAPPPSPVATEKKVSPTKAKPAPKARALNEAPIAPAPAGLSAAASARAPVEPVAKSEPAPTEPAATETISSIIAIIPPSTELPSIPLPPRGELSNSDYRVKLGVERRKTEELMGKPGLSPAEWRQQRDYNRALSEVLRTLIG